MLLAGHHCRLNEGRKEGGHALFFFYYYFFFLPIPEEPSSTSRYDLESGLCMDVCERNFWPTGLGARRLLRRPTMRPKLRATTAHAAAVIGPRVVGES